MDRIAQDPTRHQVIDSATQVYDPEIVLAIRFEADADGWAHSMAGWPRARSHGIPARAAAGGRALDRADRRRGCAGFVLPPPASTRVRLRQRTRQVRSIPGRGIVRIDMITGYLGKAEADAMEERIQSILR